MAENAYIKRNEKRLRSVLNVYDGAGLAFLTEMENRRYSHASLESYVTALKDFFLFSAASGIERLQDVDPAILERYRCRLGGRDLSGWTVSFRVRTLRLFFGYLEENGRIFLNPASDLSPGEPVRKAVPVPSVTEVKRMLAAPDPETPTGARDRAVMEVCYRCGFMARELVKLNIATVNLEKGMLRIPLKAGKGRSVPLEKPALAALKKYLTGPREKLLDGRIDEKALWVDRFGRRMDSQALCVLFRVHSKKTGIGCVSSLILRRARAVHLLASGEDPDRLRRLFGYSQKRHLARFLGMSSEELAELSKRKDLT